MLKTIPCLALAALVLLAIPAGRALAGREGAAKANVLVLHSYYSSFIWTEGLDAGIHDVLNDAKHLDIYTEYMDSKRFESPELFNDLHRLYHNKYRHTRFAAIIACDDNALRFLLDYRGGLFPGVPVVFCGVNNFPPGMLDGQTGITGKVEHVNLSKTLDVALALHPRTRRVVIIVDTTTTGQGTAALARAAVLGRPSRISFEFLDDLPMGEILGRVAGLAPDSLVVLLNFNRDRDGKVFSHQESIALLNEVCLVPIYGVWDFHLGRGIVGGAIVNGREEGAAAARMALAVMRGEDMARMPVVDEPAQDLAFDYPQLVRFGIDPASLPKGSRLLNGPQDFYALNKRLIWSLGAILAFLSLVTVVLSVAVVQRQRAQQALRQVNRALLTLSSCNRAMLEARAEPELLGEICRIVVEEGGYDQAWVGYPEPSRPGSSLVVAHWSREGEGGGPDAAGEAPEPESALGPGGALGPRQVEPGRIRLPLSVQEVAFGVLGIKARHQADFASDEVELLEKLADNLSYGIMTLNLAQERNQAQEALQQSNARLSLILESLPIVPFTCALGDPQNMTYVGGAIERITGYPPERFTGGPGFWLEHLHPEDREPVLAQLGNPEELLRQALTYRFRKADGSYAWFEDIRRAAENLESRAPLVFGALHDITRRENLRQEAQTRLDRLIQAEKMTSLGEIVAGVAHEINNPNSFLSYNLPLLQDNWRVLRPLVAAAGPQAAERLPQGLNLAELTAEMDEIIDAVRDGSSRINAVVSQLRDYVRYEPASPRVELDLNQVLQRTLAFLGAQIRKSFASFGLELAPDLPPVWGNSTKLMQVITNLVVNAINAAPDRQTSRLVIASRALSQRRVVLMQVRDNGRGMPAEVQERIFEPFFTTRRDSGGTGLGLAVALRVVEELGGVLTCASRPGAGTCFSLLLPAASFGGLDYPPAVAWVAGPARRTQEAAELLRAMANRRALINIADPERAEAWLADLPQVGAVVLDAEGLGPALMAWRRRLRLALPLLRVGWYAADGASVADATCGEEGPDFVLTPPLRAALEHDIFRCPARSLI
ncbi:MAG: ATP-binding protein [Pseudomonadota bacterium]